jgi:16S rRNA (cytosine967-C5)-methyltransferase
MKLHRNLVLAIIAGLNDIFLNHKQADTVVSQLLQGNKSWGSRDRNFIADNIYTIVRYKRLYEYCGEIEATDHHALWNLLGCKLIIEQNILPDWPEFALLKTIKIEERHLLAKSIRKIRESVPDWLDELGAKEAGEDWDKELAALNSSAKLSIRTNTLKSDKAALERLFIDKGISFSSNNMAPDALVIEARQNLRNYPSYKNGLFEIQDISSQQVAPFLEAAEGMNVIDGCAGAGGKTLHLAALMNDKGKIWAVDVSENKLHELELRIRRAGSGIISPMLKTVFFERYAKQNEPWADRILLDVPCSGIGVLRRKPDSKWSLSERFIEDIKSTQAAILDRYAPLLKPGGLMVYSTCSIFPSENHEQIEKFLKRCERKFELVDERKIGCFPKCPCCFLINFWHHNFIKPLKIGASSGPLLIFWMKNNIINSNNASN